MKTGTSCIKNINLTNTLFIIHFQIAGKISKLFSLLVDSQRKERYVSTWLEEVDIFPQKMHEKLHSFFQFTNFNIALQNCSAKRMNQEILCCKVICFEMSEKEL